MRLIIKKISQGRARACDARCYNARGDVCTCVCDGLNHGIGLEAATDKTTENADKLLSEGIQIQSKLKI